jgi:hypothetical protein
MSCYTRWIGVIVLPEDISPALEVLVDKALTGIPGENLNRTLSGNRTLSKPGGRGRDLHINCGGVLSNSSATLIFSLLEDIGKLCNEASVISVETGEDGGPQFWTVGPSEEAKASAFSKHVRNEIEGLLPSLVDEDLYAVLVKANAMLMKKQAQQVNPQEDQVKRGKKPVAEKRYW